MIKMYFYNAATIQIRQQVIAKMITVMNDFYGNPSSNFSFGRLAKSLMENARKAIAGYLKVCASEIVFTREGLRQITWL